MDSFYYVMLDVIYFVLFALKMSLIRIKIL